MNGDVGVGSIDEHAFEIFDVPADPVRLVTVRPRHDDVARVTLGQTGPFLVTEDVEIECIEGRKACGALVSISLRSEERRVGKERRVRWRGWMLSKKGM